jgi:hypothetical protein
MTHCKQLTQFLGHSLGSDFDRIWVLLCT